MAFCRRHPVRPSATVPAGHQSSLLQAACGLHGSFCRWSVRHAGAPSGWLPGLALCRGCQPLVGRVWSGGSRLQGPGGPRASAASGRQSQVLGWAVPGLLGLVSASWRVWMVHDTAGWGVQAVPKLISAHRSAGPALGLLVEGSRLYPLWQAVIALWLMSAHMWMGSESRERWGSFPHPGG